MSTWTPSWSPRHSGLTEARDTSSTDHVLLDVHRSASSPGSCGHLACECARAMKQIPHGHTGLSSHSSRLMSGCLPASPSAGALVCCMWDVPGWSLVAAARWPGRNVLRGSVRFSGTMMRVQSQSPCPAVQDQGEWQIECQTVLACACSRLAGAAVGSCSAWSSCLTRDFLAVQ